MVPVLADSVRLADDGVHILDRRVFPAERVWVRHRTVEEVARAIEDMVTQSSGPYFAALWAMVLAAREAVGLEASAARAYLENAAARLVATRPTNNHLRKAVHAVLSAVDDNATGDQLVAGALAGARAGDERYRRRSRLLGRFTAELLPDNGSVLTHCWADLYLVELVRAADKAGKRLSFVCTETRPYLQGARLTAPTLVEMGVEARVIADGMGAAVLAAGEVDALVTAADRVTMDGHVINKVGTLGLAVAAHTFEVPFLAMVQAPDRMAVTAAEVPIEYHTGDDWLTGSYPAFDVTPPKFVGSIVTDRGAFDPRKLADYYREKP